MSTHKPDVPTKRLRSAMSALLSSPILLARHDSEGIARSIKSCVEVDDDKLLTRPFPRAIVIAEDAVAVLEKRGWIRSRESSEVLTLVNGDHNIQLTAGEGVRKEGLQPAPWKFEAAIGNTAEGTWKSQLCESEQDYREGTSLLLSLIEKQSPVLLQAIPSLDPGLIDTEELTLFCTFRDHEAVALIREFWDQYPHEYC